MGYLFHNVLFSSFLPLQEIRHVLPRLRGDDTGRKRRPRLLHGCVSNWWGVARFECRGWGSLAFYSRTQAFKRLRTTAIMRALTSGFLRLRIRTLNRLGSFFRMSQQRVTRPPENKATLFDYQAPPHVTNLKIGAPGVSLLKKCTDVLKRAAIHRMVRILLNSY